MQKANLDIRNLAKDNHVPLWLVGSRAFGIGDINFCRKLRRELSIEEKARCVFVISEIVAERNEDGNG